MDIILSEDNIKNWIDKADRKKRKAECSTCGESKTFAAWQIKAGFNVCAHCEKTGRETRRRQTVRLITQAMVKEGMMRKKLCEVCNAWKVQAHHPDYTKPFHVVWLCVDHHRAFHIWQSYQHLQSSGVKLDPRSGLDEMLEASLAELQRQWQARLTRDRETSRPEIFSRIKAMLERRRIIGDDEGHHVKDAEILEWLREATGGKQP